MLVANVPQSQLNSAPRQFTSKAPSCRAAGPGRREAEGQLLGSASQPQPSGLCPSTDFLSTSKHIKITNRHRNHSDAFEL